MIGSIVYVTVEHVAQIISLRMGSPRMGMIVPRGFFFMQCYHHSHNDRLMRKCTRVCGQKKRQYQRPN